MPWCFCCCKRRSDEKNMETGMVKTVVSADPNVVTRKRKTKITLTSPTGAEPLDESDKKMIKESADLLVQDKDKCVDLLIMLFELYPEHKSRFKVFRNSTSVEIKKAPQSKLHGEKVLESLWLLISCMDDPQKLEERAAVLKDFHAERKVYANEIKDMFIVLVEFLAVEMGKDFTPELETAWERWSYMILNLLEPPAKHSKQFEGASLMVEDLAENLHLGEKHLSVSD